MKRKIKILLLTMLLTGCSLNYSDMYHDFINSFTNKVLTSSEDSHIKVYDPIIYVEKIVWDYSEFENRKNYKIELFTEEEKQQGIGYDARLTYLSFEKIDNLVINIKCHVEPLNATTLKLDYYLDVADNPTERLEVLEDNTANVIFNGNTYACLNILSTDGKGVEYRIKFEMIEFDFFGY